MPLIGGADGCKDGWILVTKELSSGLISWRICTSTEELFYGKPTPEILGIDIPIGLTDSGPRGCDKEARRALGAGRGSSVFPAPIRCLLNARTYSEACALRCEAEGKKISQQAWNILPKIRIVDRLMLADRTLQERVREVHPELCFMLLAGHPIQQNKKKKQGQEERLRALEPWFGEALHAAIGHRSELHCALDDLLDAFAVCRTAERIYSGLAKTLPAEPPRDAAGLRMEIVV